MADESSPADRSDEAAASPPPPAVPPAAPPANYWVVPERPALQPAPGYEYVGFWRRAVAMFIDSIVLTIVAYAILIPLMLHALSASDLAAFSSARSYTIDPVTGMAVPSPALMAAMTRMMSQLFLGFGLVLLLEAAYFVILWWLRGASLGQMALGVEVRQETDGRRIGFWRSCLRFVGFLISGWALLLGFIWVAFDGRKQGWHDKIAGTLVVRRIR